MRYEISVRFKKREVNLLSQMANLGFAIFKESEMTQEVRSVDNIHTDTIDFNNDTLKSYKCIYNGNDDFEAQTIIASIMPYRQHYESMRIWCRQD